MRQSDPQSALLTDPRENAADMRTCAFSGLFCASAGAGVSRHGDIRERPNLIAGHPARRRRRPVRRERRCDRAGRLCRSFSTREVSPVNRSQRGALSSKGPVKNDRVNLGVERAKVIARAEVPSGSTGVSELGSRQGHGRLSPRGATSCSLVFTPAPGVVRVRSETSPLHSCGAGLQACEARLKPCPTDVYTTEPRAARGYRFPSARSCTRDPASMFVNP